MRQWRRKSDHLVYIVFFPYMFLINFNTNISRKKKDLNSLSEEF